MNSINTPIYKSCVVTDSVNNIYVINGLLRNNNNTQNINKLQIYNIQAKHRKALLNRFSVPIGAVVPIGIASSDASPISAKGRKA